MQVTKIVVHAGRTFNHPHEQYSNLKPGVTMEAILSEGDNPLVATKELQAQAEQLVEDHKQNLLKSIEELYQMTERKSEMVGLHRQLTNAQTRLEEIRKEWPQMAQLNLNNEEP